MVSFSRIQFQKQRESRQAEYMLTSVLRRIYIEIPHITLQAAPLHRTVALTHTVRSSPCSPYVGACQCYDAQMLHRIFSSTKGQLEHSAVVRLQASMFCT